MSEPAFTGTMSSQTSISKVLRMAVAQNKPEPKPGFSYAELGYGHMGEESYKELTVLWEAFRKLAKDMLGQDVEAFALETYDDLMCFQELATYLSNCLRRCGYGYAKKKGFSTEKALALRDKLLKQDPLKQLCGG